MPKVFISPQFKAPDRADGGIRRVIDAMCRYLPDYGIEVVDDPYEADVINCHAGDLVNYPPDKPLVASSHGLYWSNYEWPHSHYQANEMVIENMVRSKAVTAPSRWVAAALARGIARPIVPIHHGVQVTEWSPGENWNYVLWNKARADVISDPSNVQRLAELMPNQQFYSTLGKPTDNLKIIGTGPYNEMGIYTQSAGVYLSTARETFGIGTLEAMASGVPVVGWDYGGNSEIVTNDQTGYLVPPGDYELLREAVIRAFSERDRLSANCRDDVRERWEWSDKIAQYAKIFNSVWAQGNIARPKLSIIVTCYNLGRYLTACLTSVLALPFDDWECIIVDDKSTDDTRRVARKFCIKDQRFIYREPESNLGLSGARNLGFSASSGEYILPLDADDVLTPGGVIPLVEALDKDPSIHIAYGNLVMMSEDGQQFHKDVSQSNDFNWFAQMSHVNQPFYCAMVRREVLRDSGGYRRRDWRAEDAAFWCRVTSFGFRAAKVTDEPTVFYRLRPDSKGSVERQRYKDQDGDWTAWYGWRIASNHSDGIKALSKKQTPEPSLVPFAAQGRHTKSWNIDHHQQPLVSVIIPVGPGHEIYLIDTLDSLTAQTFTSWEAVVINDIGNPLDLPAHQWATIVHTDGARGAGHARNQGLQAARGDLVLFLDADDWLLRDAMRDMVTEYVRLEGQRYIYTNYVSVDPKGKVKNERLKTYKQEDWHGQHAVTVLLPRVDAIGVGGFDEDMPGWEDWDFAIKCALNGICGHLLPIEAFVYRNFSGQRRDIAATQIDDLLPPLKARYAKYYTGEKQIMACGDCGGGKAADVLMNAKRAMAPWTSATTAPSPTNNGNGRSNMTRMKFIGQRPGSKDYIRISGQLLKRSVRGGANTVGRYVDADPADVELLKSTGEWAIEETPTNAGDANLPAPVPINYEQIGGEVEATIQPANFGVTYKASPQAIEEAQTAGIALAEVTGTGRDGKITVRDVRNAVRA